MTPGHTKRRWGSHMLLNYVREDALFKEFANGRNNTSKLVPGRQKVSVTELHRAVEELLASVVRGGVAQLNSRASDRSALTTYRAHSSRNTESKIDGEICR